MEKNKQNEELNQLVYSSKKKETKNKLLKIHKNMKINNPLD